MKEKLKRLWRKVTMTAKEIVETIRNAVTDPKNMMAIGLVGMGLSCGVFAGGYLRYKMA